MIVLPPLQVMNHLTTNCHPLQVGRARRREERTEAEELVVRVTDRRGRWLTGRQGCRAGPGQFNGVAETLIQAAGRRAGHPFVLHVERPPPCPWGCWRRARQKFEPFRKVASSTATAVAGACD